jgi:hypothetical protein
VKYELPPDNRNRPDSELLGDLKRVADSKRQDTLSRAAYDRDGRFSSGTLIARFGSWNNALERAGLKVSKRQSIAEFEFLEDLRQVSAGLMDATLTESAYRASGRFSPSAIVRRFGSWANALTTAGLDAGHLPKEADVEQLFANLERVWERLGRAPKRDEMRRPLSEFSAGQYLRQFGKWRTVLEEFVAAANGPVPPTPPVDAADAPAPSAVSDQPKRRTGRNVGWRLRFRVFQRDRFRCRACAASPDTTRLHVDHVKPWSLGGETVIENLQTLCERCNIGKGADDQRAG